MNYDILKKIPFFKNLDFTEAKDRKSAFMVLGVILGIILLIVMNIVKGSGKEDDDQARIELVKSNMPEIPEGEDNEILDAENVEDTHDHAKRQAIRNLNELFFNKDNMSATAEDETDPLSILNGDEQRPSQPENRLSARRRADEFFGLTEDDLDSKDEYGNPRSNVFGQDSWTQSNAESKQAISERVSDIKRTMEDPYTPEEYARRSRGGGYREPEPEEYTYEAHPEAEAEPTPEPVKIRKTGTLSGFDDEWGNLSKGVKGLDDRTQFLSSSDIKPVKVAFIKEEKLQSGQRVTLRLLDDMYADGIIIQKNSHVSATCQVGNRLTLTVNRVEVNGDIHELHYVAVDNDGNEGLYCPQTQQQELGGQLTNDAVSIANQAIMSKLGGAGNIISGVVSSGAQVVSSVAGKKTATVSSGYTFYLVQKEN